MEISLELVRTLRDKTGAGVVDCKKALAENQGDMEKAVEYLKKKGLAAAAKKVGRTTAEGLVHSYIHMGGKIGVLLEVNCETDFVAKTDDFRTLVHDLAMQIAASNPEYVGRQDVPAETLEKEKEIFRAQAAEQKKPPQVVEKIVTGKLEKFYADACLLEQPFVKDPDRQVCALLTETIAKLGENITIRRFSRFQLGEGIERRCENLREAVAKAAG